MNIPAQRPRKRFGQNFLRDQAVLDEIVLAIDPKPGEQVLEIGPGRGALTQRLIECEVKLTAVELDRDLVNLLHNRFAGESFALVSGDALKIDLDTVMPPPGPWRVVGNLPYNISTPLLFRLLEFSDRIADMYFVLQREVVERLSAPSGCKAYGRLSVMAQHLCEVQGLFEIDPRSFRPVPKVVSQLVRLHPRPPRAAPADTTALEGLLRCAFSQRRKSLRHALRPLLTVDAMLALGIDPSRRPETLSLSEFQTLAEHIAARDA